MRITIALASLLLSASAGFSQDNEPFRHWNPADSGYDYIGGQAWPEKRTSPYDRLPASAQKAVRNEVRDLSRHTAGLFVAFRTTSPSIQVNYTVSGEKALPHMPATGVSGVDLYSRSGNGPWLWSAGRFSFKDTISYRYENLSTDTNRVYTLYFPLYNQVTWLEIKVPASHELHPVRVNKDKPIVVYGTSIAQGACATRPGLAWAAILGREIDVPIVNLGFSGNGRLEPELIERIAALDASMYILDCLPNMTGDAYVNGELQQRLLASIRTLQELKPGLPIVLTEHAGLTGESTNVELKKTCEKVNGILSNLADSLIRAGTKNIHVVKKKHLGQQIGSMVDGVHPNDLGMHRYAQAYAQAIRKIRKAR